MTCLSVYMYRHVHDLIPGNISFFQNFFRSPNKNIPSTNCVLFFSFLLNSLQLSADYHYRSIKHRLLLQNPPTDEWFPRLYGQLASEIGIGTYFQVLKYICIHLQLMQSPLFTYGMGVWITVSDKTLTFRKSMNRRTSAERASLENFCIFTF